MPGIEDDDAKLYCEMCDSEQTRFSLRAMSYVPVVEGDDGELFGLVASGYFCSWDHVVAWVARGEPQWKDMTDDDEDLQGGVPWGCLLIAATILSLLVIGLVTVARWIA